MRKTGDSLRAQGLTGIAVDKPTRSALKRLAEQAGLPVSHYLRLLATKESQDTQFPFSGVPVDTMATKQDITQLKIEIAKFAKAMVAVAGVSLGALAVPDEFWTGEKSYTFDEIFDLARKAKTEKEVEFATQEKLKLA